jgi:hypothetical protein
MDWDKPFRPMLYFHYSKHTYKPLSTPAEFQLSKNAAMNFKKIISDIENTDSLALEKPSQRRDVIKKIGTSIAATAIPLSLSSVFNKANAQTAGTSIISSLNFLLELEYFEYNFFRTANRTDGLIAVSDQAGFTDIESHELAHISILSNAITGLGGTAYLPNHYNNNPYCPAAYDFTASGQYPIYYTGNYYLFLDFAQLFQDLFARAYIGVIPNLTGNATALTTVMQLLSVEGRHASYVRTVRRFTAQATDDPKPWITNNNSLNSTPPTEFEPFYAGENNVIQMGIDITTLPGIIGTISQTAATEAFDEPLDQTTVLSLIAQFMLP